MRKDVKRSLLLWPAAASAAIGALTWVNEIQPNLSASRLQSSSHARAYAASEPLGGRESIDASKVTSPIPSVDAPFGSAGNSPAENKARLASELQFASELQLARELQLNAWTADVWGGIDDGAERLLRILRDGNEKPKSARQVEYSVSGVAAAGKAAAGKAAAGKAAAGKAAAGKAAAAAVDTAAGTGVAAIGSVVERRPAGDRAMPVPARLAPAGTAGGDSAAFTTALAIDSFLVGDGQIGGPSIGGASTSISADASVLRRDLAALCLDREVRREDAPTRCPAIAVRASDRDGLAGLPETRLARSLRRIGDHWRDFASTAMTTAAASTAQAAVELAPPVSAIALDAVEIPQSVSVLAKPESVTSAKPAAAPLAASLEVPTVKSIRSTSSDAPRIAALAETVKSKIDRRRSEPGVSAWPMTRDLNQQLSSLIDFHRSFNPATLASTGPDAAGDAASRVQVDAAMWAKEVAEDLSQLQSLRRIGERRAGVLIGSLESHAASGFAAAEACEDRDQQREWLRAAHALSRRVAVWRPVWDVVGDHHQAAAQIGPAVELNDPADIAGLTATVRKAAEATGDPAGWGDFLLLDRIEEAAASQSIEKRAHVARRLLSRLQWHALDDRHARWLETASVTRLVDAVRPWATTAIDYASLLRNLEQQESDSIDLASIRIAGTADALRFADNAAAVKVSEALNTHYRNANVRLSVSEALLNRIVPTVAPKTVPVRATILGSRVRGYSYVNSELNVDLRPSANAWAIDLLARGNVTTDSTGRSGPVAVRTDNRSRFRSFTPVHIGREGIRVANSTVEVSGRQRLRDLRTDYDRLPLVGTLVRSIAEARVRELRPLASRIANRRVKDQVRREIASEVTQRADRAATRFTDSVMAPLAQMNLAPSVMDLETTHDRLLARYRVAGPWQLGAFTPRPRAPGGSLMSLQVHQTALNNTIEQLVPQDKQVSIAEVIEAGLVSFGRDPESIELPAEVPSDVKIQFARTRPITVEIEEGKMVLTLRIVRLSQADRIDLRRFIVRAEYVPQADGLHAELVRSGHLRINGPGMSMRERLPLRAIFNKVLSSSRTLPLTVPGLVDHPAARGLAVRQLELRDGWIGLAIGDAPSGGSQGSESGDESGEPDGKVAVMGISRR